MRDFPSGLSIDAQKTTLGWLLAIEPVGLDPVYLSTIGGDYVDASETSNPTYLGSPGFVMKEARFTDGSDPPSLSVEIPVSDDGPVTGDAVTRGLYRDAPVRVKLVDHESMEVADIGFEWLVGLTSITDDGKAAFEIRAATRVRRELVLKTFGPGCKWNLGDTGCAVDVAGSWTDTVEIVALLDAYSFTINGARSGAVDDFYANGAIKFTSGSNIGRAYTVRSYIGAGDIIKLWEPLRLDVAPGDTALIHAGCDKTTGANGCTRFANLARRFAFDFLPPDDAKFTYEAEATTPGTTGDVPQFQGGFGFGGGWMAV